MTQRHDYNDALRALHQHLVNSNEAKRFRVFDRAGLPSPYARLVSAGNPDRQVVIWCSNDYLSLSRDERIANAAIDTIRQCGVGSGSVRSLTGTNTQHIKLEEELAEWHGKEACLLYNSAFVANESAISVFGRALESCVIFSDILNHNSIIQGVRQAGVTRQIFDHNSPASLREKLLSVARDTYKIIICESVYSMNGDIAPLDQYCDLADEFGAYLYVDEVHAVGMYGRSGAGIAEREDISDRIDVIEGTLAKAIGVIGGYVAGTQEFVNWVKQKSPGFIFSTSLPPAMAEAARVSVQILRRDTELRDRHQRCVRSTVAALKSANLPVMSDQSHIIPLFVGSAEKAQQMAEELLYAHCISIQAILAPAVPRGRERLRITPSPSHTAVHIRQLVDALSVVWEKFSGPRMM